MTKQEHLLHAQHNEKACYFIDNEGTLNDWVITTAFYSALHFVSYRIFPCEIYDRNGRKVNIWHLEMYHKGFSHAYNKHKSLINLVEDNCNEIADIYDWLYSTCMTARYSNYNQSKHFSDKALRYLKEVKEYCVNI